MIFPCSKCGICCQNITGIEELESYDMGNGTCKYFDISSDMCTIYDTRPNICRIDKMFDLKYKKSFSKLEFYNLNAKACNELQEKFNLNKKYRIQIGE